MVFNKCKEDEKLAEALSFSYSYVDPIEVVYEVLLCQELGSAQHFLSAKYLPSGKRKNLGYWFSDGPCEEGKTDLFMDIRSRIYDAYSLVKSGELTEEDFKIRKQAIVAVFFTVEMFEEMLKEFKDEAAAEDEFDRKVKEQEDKIRKRMKNG